MESQGRSCQEVQQDGPRTDLGEETKDSSKSIDEQIEEVLCWGGFESIEKLMEGIEKTKQRILECAKRPKQLRDAQEELQQLESLYQKHAQLVQLKNQKLRVENALDNDDKPDENPHLSPLIDASLKPGVRDTRIFYNTNNWSPHIEVPQQIFQPIVEEEKNCQTPVKQNQVQNQRDKEDASNIAGFIKSAPDSFEKSIRLLTHILYSKLDNSRGYDQVLGLPTTNYNDLIRTHLTNMRETFVGEVIDNDEIMRKINSLQYPDSENPEQLKSILNCLKQIQPLVCKFNFQEFFSYFDKADEASKRLGSCSSDSIVLLLGTSGAGKSTTIHYLCGSEMYETQIKELKHIAFGTVKNSDLQQVTVSPNARSETRYIKPIDIDMQQLGASRTPQHITLVDTPGLFDLKNAEVDVSNQLCIVKALSQVNSIKPFIILSYKRLGSKGEGLKEILKFYAQMIVNSKHISFFNFFFSHVDQDVRIENLKARIEDILENLTQQEKLNERLVKFLNVILDRAEEKKLFIINPLDRNQIIPILKEIQRTEGIEKPKQVFQKVISQESSQKIIEQFDLHAKAIQSSFKNCEALRVDFLLSELKRFCEIMDSNQDYKQKLNDILKKLNQILSNKYDEVVSTFQKQLQPGNKITEQQVNTYQSNFQFLSSLEAVRQKYLCQIDGDLNLTRSFQDIETEVERLINCASFEINQSSKGQLDHQIFQDFIYKLDVLANSHIQNFVSIRDQFISEIIGKVNTQAYQATDLLGNIMTLKSINSNIHQKQTEIQMSQKDNEEEIKDGQQYEQFVVLPLDQFSDLLKQLEKAAQVTKNQTLKDFVEQKIKGIVSYIQKKFEDMNTQNFPDIDGIILQYKNNIQDLSDVDLYQQADIQMNIKKVELIQKYYQFLENFIYSMKSYNLSQGLIDPIKGRLTELNDKIIFWYSVQEEKLKRKIFQDRKYSAIKSIYAEIMLVTDLPPIKGQTMRQNRIKINLAKLLRDKSEEARKYIKQFENLFLQRSQEEFQSKETKDHQWNNFYALVSLKEAMRTIKDLRWTVEGNEDIFEELKEELQKNLQKLVNLIEESVRNSREDSVKYTQTAGIEQALKHIIEIQSIAQIIGIELPDINFDYYISEIEQNINGCEKFFSSKDGSSNNEEQKSDIQSSVYLLKKQECDKFFTYYTNINKYHRIDSMIKKIDQKGANLSERVKNLHKKLENFVSQHMEKVDYEFQRQLSLMKQYLLKIKTIARNEEGFYDTEENQNQATQYLEEYLVNPVEIILGIFKMIKQLKQDKYQQLWNKFRQNEDHEENFKNDILNFYREVDRNIVRGLKDQVQITNGLKVINQLIPLDSYVNEQNEQRLFQKKYDGYFSNLCNFHNEVVNKVEEYIKNQKYDEIKDNLITLKQLDGQDQQNNLRKVQQKLKQKCYELNSQITKEIKFLHRDQQLDVLRTEELNKKTTELYEIVEKIGENFLTKPVYDNSKNVLEKFKQSISSNFEKIREFINIQIQNNNFSEAYDSIIKYQNHVRMFDVTPSQFNQSEGQLSSDYFDEAAKLQVNLNDSLKQKVLEIDKAIKDAKFQNDDSILIQIKEKSLRHLIENLQKSSNDRLLESAKTIIECVQVMFNGKITTLNQRVDEQDPNSEEIFLKINDYLQFCQNFPQDSNVHFQERIFIIKKQYLEQQEIQSNVFNELFKNRYEDSKQIEKVYNHISTLRNRLGKSSQQLFNDFFKQACGKALDAVKSDFPLNIQENIYQLWKFQSSNGLIYDYLDASAIDSFQDLIKFIQDIYQQITENMFALFQRREFQNTIDVLLFSWFHDLFKNTTYQTFASSIIPNAGESLLEVIDVGIQVIGQDHIEFSRLIKIDEVEALCQIFPIILFMRKINPVMRLLINLDTQILLESAKRNVQDSVETYKKFLKLSEEANNDKYCGQISLKYIQLDQNMIQQSSFFAKTYSELDFQERKIQYQKLAKYLTFLQESQLISQDLNKLKIFEIDKCQKQWQEKISNYFTEKILSLKNQLKKLDNLNPIRQEDMEHINNLMEEFFISSESFKTYFNFSDLKQRATEIIQQLQQGYAADIRQAQNIANLLIKLQEISINIKQLKECAQQAVQEAIEWLSNSNLDQAFITQIAHLLRRTPAGSIIVEKYQIFICVARQMWGDRIQRQHIDYVLDNLKQNDGNLLSEHKKKELRDLYDRYQEEYKKLVETNIVPYEKIPDNMIDIKTRLFELTQEQKQKKIDDIALAKIHKVMACLFALWTLSDFHKNKLTCDPNNPFAVPYLLKPHPAQVISIFRIFGQGYDNIIHQGQVHPLKETFIGQGTLFDNLVQIKTGEGKSITLAITISIFALWDFEVSCACYSQYLSQRDFQSFKHLFQFLNIEEKIFYGTFNQICENYINKDGDIRNMTLNRILKGSNIEIRPKAQADKRVILIDEVDVFFSKEFFNKMYAPVAIIKDPKVSNLLDYVWNNRENQQFLLKDIYLSNQYNECKALFNQKYAGILDEACKQMFSAIQNFQHHDYIVQDQKIGYQDMELVSFSKSYGYNTIFAYYYHEQIAKDGQKVSKQNLDASKALEVCCALFSYAEIPLYSLLILGVTGTLDSLSISEKSIVNDVFQIRNFTYSPSVYGENKLKWKELPRYDRTIILSGQAYFMELTNEITKKIALNNSQRAVIVFFKTLDALKKYKNSPGYAQLTCSKQDLTEFLDDPDKESKIIRATYSKTLTLTTRSFGRGTDFICRDEAVEVSGGVHVILTFVPEMHSEFIQIQGRTARQGNSGSFQMILLDSELSEFDIDVGSADYQAEHEDKLAFIIQKRDSIMSMRQQGDAQAIDQIQAKHRDAIGIKNILVQNNPSDSDSHSQYLIRLNRGPASDPVKTLILMDATGSMSKFLQQAKDSVHLMYERSEEILKHNRLDPQLNLIQYACYRNYSSGDLILQNSAWESNPDRLKSFMDSITASGGMGNEAVEIGLQHAVREAEYCGSIPLRQVYLIGDMPPNTRQQVERAREKYQFWKKSKRFADLAEWPKELKKLQKKNIRVNTFYVHDKAKEKFTDIALRSRGTCTYLDLSLPNSQETLLSLFVPSILEMIAVARDDPKLGQKMQKDYFEKYNPQR